VIVVDTNILAYRWLPGPHAEGAESLVARDPEWAAPLLWRSEFRNVLAGMVRSGRLALADAEAAVHRAHRCLLGGEHTVSDRAVLALVAQSRCTAYDCEYVALAQALGTVLVTEDKALQAAFPRVCRSLGRMPG
jgi:predicted nucleic acid-binding protein